MIRFFLREQKQTKKCNLIQKSIAMWLCFILVLGTFSPLSATDVAANGRYIRTEYVADKDSYQFVIKADNAEYAYIRGAFTDNWSVQERFKAIRAQDDRSKTGEMRLTVPAAEIEGKGREYKAYIYYGNASLTPPEIKDGSAPEYAWMTANGWNENWNETLPDRVITPAPQNPGELPQPISQGVQTIYHQAAANTEAAVEFVIQANGLDEVYVMCQANNWAKDNLANLSDYKAVRQPEDTDKTGPLKVIIPYSKLNHWYKKYQYKIFAKDGQRAIWYNAEGKDAENSFFPTEDGQEYDNILEAVVMDEENKIKAVVKEGYDKIETEYDIWVDGEKKATLSPNKQNKELQFDITSIWNNDFDIKKVIKIVRKDGKTKVNVVKRELLDKLYYDSDDLGVRFTENQISVKLWAPTAQKVELLLYDNYTNQGFETEKQNPVQTFVMDYDATSGVYSKTIEKQFQDKYYLFRLTFGEEIKYAVDPYAVAVGVNGKMGALVDLNDSATVPEGFASDVRPELKKPEDSILYEMHVRDFTINQHWGGPDDKAGKYLGIIEKGTKYTDTTGKEVKTGLDHLVDLGITHVHLLPTYDFATIDESAAAPYDSTSANEKANQRNWGYDPKNYNVPDGSYSLNPNDPKVRIKEYRQMVMGLHQAGIRVVNDVVYNHMYDMENMNNIVEGYYFRSWPNGVYSNDSGVGNAIASERPMVRKFILDSCKHWVDHYKIDGLRFDLMAILDAETMKQIKADMDSRNQNIIVYGEPWMALDSPLPQHEQTKKDKNIGFFNDTYRDALRGNNDASKGYITGAYNNVGKVLEGLRANDAADPEYIINYVEAHDNYAIWDQVEKSENPNIQDGKYRIGVRENALEDWRVDKALLGNAFVLLSQGIPFFQGGSEILRTKQGDHNSYRSNDVINDYDWNDKAEFDEVYNYYKGLIRIRKEQSLFRLTTKEDIANHQEVGRLDFKDDMIYQYLKNNTKDGEWKNIVVLYNASNERRKITWLPGDADSWTVAADDAGVYLDTEENQRRVVTKEGDNFDFEIAQNSLMILYNNGKPQPEPNIHWHYLFADQSKDYMEPLEPTSTENVTVRFRAKAGELTVAELHYFVEGENDAKVITMTEAADAFYQERGYDKSKVIFYEAVIPASDKNKYYHFKAINRNVSGQEKVAWISAGKGEDGRGVRQNMGDKGFSIVPGYKTSKWSRESIFYQIMVDRFRDGDSTNNKVKYDFAQNDDRPELSDWGSEIFTGEESDHIWNNQFFGGDLIGVKEAIPYLKNTLGVDAVYLMPIFQSDSDHKYDGESYEEVDNTFGGNKALANLGQAFVQNGMNYILDGAFNHSSSSGRFFRENRELFFKGEYRDEHGNVYDHYPWHQKYFNFAKLDYSKEQTKDYIYRSENAIAKRYLKAPYFAGGWRLDAAEDVSEIARDYKENEQTDAAQLKSNLKIWQDFASQVRQVAPDSFILGEYWGNENHWYYGKAWDGKMNYGGFYLPFIENCSANAWLGSHSLDNKNNMSVADMVRFSREYMKDFPYSTILGSTNSLSTHDKPRFLNVDYAGKNNAAIMKLAQTLQMTMPGIPLIYYGDEIGAHGKGNGNDPYNRQTFTWEDDTWNYEMLNNYRKLIDVRKKHKNAFVYGALEEIVNNHEKKYVAYARYGNQQKAIVILNNNGSNLTRTIRLTDVARFGFAEDEELIDVVSGKKATVTDGELNIVSDDFTGACYVPMQSYTAVNVLTAENYDVNTILADENDTRAVVKQPENVVYQKSANGEVTVSYELPADAKGALVRVVTPDIKSEIKKVSANADQNEVVLTGLPEEFEIVVKSVVEPLNAQNNHGIAELRDSVYVLATEKVNPQPQPQPQPQAPNVPVPNVPSTEGNKKVEDKVSQIVYSKSNDKTVAEVKLGKQGEHSRFVLEKSEALNLMNKGVESFRLTQKEAEITIPKVVINDLKQQDTVFDLKKRAVDEKEKNSAEIQVLGDWTQISAVNQKTNQAVHVKQNVYLTLPVKDNIAKDKQLIAYYRQADGSLKEIPFSAYDSATGKMKLMTEFNTEVTFGYRKETSSFEDIDNHFAESQIKAIVAKGLMRGVSPKQFAAEQTLNRAMLLTILGRLAQVESNQLLEASVFEDVSRTSYYAPYVDWAYRSGIIKGVSATEFAPNQSVTREQAAVILARFIEHYQYDITTGPKGKFKDADNFSDYSSDSIQRLYENGLLQGFDGFFYAKKDMKRGEISVLLQRLIELRLQSVR